MKRGILLLNGEPYEGAIDAENAVVVCCDGAYRWAKGKIRIDENVGDFDSLGEVPVPAPLQVYPSEKNYTDGEIGLRKLIDYGCTEIEIYGGGGGREDHFLGNVHLLYYALQKGVRAKLITKYSTIYPISGKVTLKGEKGKTFSLLPFGGEAHIMSGEGVKYPYCDLTLRYGSCRGLSNIALEEECRFNCDKGVVLLCMNENPVTEGE